MTRQDKRLRGAAEPRSQSRNGPDTRNAPLYLVTGGAGFIGSHLVEQLVESGKRVRVLDDLSTGKHANIAPFLDHIDSREASILDLDAVRAAMDGVRYVLHQAALSSVPHSMQDPLATQRVNVEGTLNVLLAAREARVQRVILASSSSVYGNPPVERVTETLPPMPLSPYAASKLAAEEYGRVFYRAYGLETISLRYFNVFGPRQDPDSEYAAVIPQFVTALLAARQPVIYGNGEQSRDFVYVSDVVAANLAALEAEGAPGEAINIASGKGTTINALAAMLGECTGKGVTPVHSPKRPGDVEHSVAEIRKARLLLRYEPRVTVQEGLARTVAWHLGL